MKNTIFTLILGFYTIVSAQPGTFDTSFSTDGYDVFDFGGGQMFYTKDVAILSDGTIVTAGYYTVGGDYFLFLKAYNTDGTSNNSFDSDGELDLLIPGALNSESKVLHSIAVTADDKIVVAGAYNGDVFVARLNADGSYDTSFNTVGYVTYDSGVSETAFEVAVRGNNAVLVSGNAGVASFLLKYTAAGLLDNSFGTNGVSINQITTNDQPHGLAIQSDGKILTAGFSAPASVSFAARYDSTGFLDNSFNSNGKILFNTTIPLGNWDYINDVVVLNSGKIVVGGFYQTSSYFGALVRINSDGSFDTSFGVNGLVSYRHQSTATVYNSMTYSTFEDKIYLAGYSNVGGESQLITKFNSDGIHDVSFGTNGDAHFNFSVGLYDRAEAMVLDNSNKLVFVGNGDNTGYKGVTARLNNTAITLPSPSVVGPVLGLTGVSIQPTFTWNVVSGAASYKLQIATDAGFSNLIYDQSSGTDTTVSFDEFDANFPLTAGTKYYWRVASVLGSGTEFYTSSMHFTTVQSISVSHGHPTGGIVYTGATNFGWYLGQATNGLKFKFQITRTTSGGNADWSATPDFEVVTTNTSYSYTLLYGQTYYWRVIVLNTSDEVLAYSSTVMFTTTGGAEIPVASWPVGGNYVYNNNPTLYWYQYSLQNGLTYDVRYREIGAGSWTEFTNISNLYYTVATALQPGRTYEWQIQSVYMRGTSDEASSGYSVSSTFVTNGAGTVVTPILSYPTGGVTVYSSNPYVYWYLGAVNTGLSFNVYYRTGGGAYTHAGTTSNLSLQLSGLTAGATYEWFATTTNGTDSLSAGAGTFTVAGGSGFSYPVVNWPTGNPTEYTATPTLSWYLEGSSLGITGYVVRVKEGSNSSNWASDYDQSYTVNDVNTTTYTFASALNFGSTYYWAVAANDGSLSTWASGSFTVIGASVAGAPIVSYPTGGVTVYDTEATLSWYMNGSTTGIVDYEIVYSNSDVFAAGATTTVTSSSQSVLVSGLTPGAIYYWKVRSIYGGGNYSSYSNPEGTFIVMPGSAPAQPIAGGPDRVVVNTLNPQFSWVLPNGPTNGSTYTLEVSDNLDMDNAMVYNNLAGANHVVENLSDDQIYYWRVKTKNSDGSYSYYSNTARFSTGESITNVDESILPIEFDLAQNYPNPFNPATTIRYALPEAANVKLTVYDILGAEVAVLVNDFVEAGNYNVNFNALNLTSGVYFYRIDAGNYKAVKKMILLK